MHRSRPPLGRYRGCAGDRRQSSGPWSGACRGHASELRAQSDQSHKSLPGRQLLRWNGSLGREDSVHRRFGPYFCSHTSTLFVRSFIIQYNNQESWQLWLRLDDDRRYRKPSDGWLQSGYFHSWGTQKSTTSLNSIPEELSLTGWTLTSIQVRPIDIGNNIIPTHKESSIATWTRPACSIP